MGWLTYGITLPLENRVTDLEEQLKVMQLEINELKMNIKKHGNL